MDVVPALIERLNDPDVVVRYHVCHALERFGHVAKAALPRLRELAKGADESLARLAQVALISIGGSDEYVSYTDTRGFPFQRPLY